MLIPIGKKGRDSLRKAGFQFAAEYVNVLARVDYMVAREIANLVSDLYAKDEIDAVYVVFSEFKNVLAPTLVVDKLLPVEEVKDDSEPGTAAVLVPCRSITSTNNPNSRFWIVCSRDMSRLRFCALCWSPVLPNMQRA